MKNIESIARAVILCDGHILVVRSVKKDGSFAHAFLPGGHIEHSEPMHQTLKREMMEEAGITGVEMGELLGVQENTYGAGENFTHEINVIFEARFPQMNLKNTPKSKESHIVYQWCRLDALQEINLQPANLLEHLPRWAKGEGKGAFLSLG